MANEKETKPPAETSVEETKEENGLIVSRYGIVGYREGWGYCVYRKTSNALYANGLTKEKAVEMIKKPLV